MLDRIVVTVIGAMLVTTCVAGCEKGPLQKTGEKLDEVTGQDRLIGKGPAEKAGRKVDNTIDDVKK